LAAFAAAIFAVTHLTPRNGSFVQWQSPLQGSDRLFDIGVVDANGDGRLDLYTSNHHFRQALLVADERGGYRDVVSEWGLDQSREFPLAELSFVAPDMDKSGLYIYWFGAQLIIRAHKIAGAEKWRGVLRVNDPVEIMRNEGFTAEKQDQTSPVGETVIRFSPSSDGLMRLEPGGQGLPITFEFDDAVPPNQVYVGRGKVSPPSTVFVLAMQDRHAMAWADFNADGILDVFINRGALGGTLRAHSDAGSRQIKDELFLSQGEGRFVEAGAKLGIEKKGCSGRHARWLDFDNDGLLDLFVNCHDREHVEGSYPKQLYRQNDQGLLRDVAEEVGIGLPDQQMASLAWFDVDNDGDLDLLAFQDEGLFLYRDELGHYVREPVLLRQPDEAEKIGHTTRDDSFYDGKITVADYDRDGDLDVFSASKRGNVLLMNENGRLSSVDLASVGLPATSITASWADYDNDGLPDLHFVPQGLFRQGEDHRFERTGLLELVPGQHDAAIVNWFDCDNDGKLDVLMTLHKTPGFKRWWELFREPKRESAWENRGFRNVTSGGNWVQIQVMGGKGNPQAIGARVTVATPAGRQTQEVGSTEGSFLSQGHYRLYFGLGRSDRASAITVRWPDGHEAELSDTSGNRLLIVEREKTR
jgi:hypothetical protein